MKRILDFRFYPKSKIQNPKLLMLTGFFLLIFSAVSWACPGCKEALFDISQARQSLKIAQGYALTIALLLGVPLALLGGVAALVVRAHRRNKHV